MADIWHEKVSVRFGNVDCSNRLTLGSIFSFFQEAAISHAIELGAGPAALARTGQAWILSRLSLFVERRPAYGETVTVSSWPRSREKIFALRDYDIRDTDDIAVVRGRGDWLIIDIEKRKPLRAQAIIESLPPNNGIDAFPAGPAILAAGENLTKKMERTALYSDIDNYGHVNNARYIQWIQDLTDPDILTNANEIRLDINYISEVKPGETVEIRTAPLIDAGTSRSSDSADYPSWPGPCFSYEGRRLAAGGEGHAPGQVVFRAELSTGVCNTEKIRKSL